MNSIVLTGRVATIPESKSTQDGLDICTFKLAVNRPSKDQAMFISIKAFGKQAQNCQKYLVKGQEVSVHGRLVVETYDRNGQKLTWVEVVAGNSIEDVEFGSKPKNAEKNQKEEKAITDVFGHGFLKDNEDLPF